MINAAVNSLEAKELWAAPGWLPEEIGVIVEGGQFFCYEGEDLRLHIQRGMHYITVYELVGLVADINSGENQTSHLVSLVNGMSPDLARLFPLTLEVAISARERQPDSQWHLFNDFLVRKVTKEEALEFSPPWKAPSVLAYQIKTASNAVDDSWKEKLDTSLLYFDYSLKYGC
jgi:PAB-dependent poly(A)-specific ribonuclease subunit 2